MNAKRKLLTAIIRNPRQVRFVEACKAAVLIGFIHRGGKGTHRAFARLDEPTLLNFQNCGGYVPPYQARQLIAMIEKYGDEP